MLSTVRFQDLVKDLTSKQDEVNEVIDEGNQVIDDHTYAEKERKLVHEKMTALHDDWNKLATLTSGKQQRQVSRFVRVRYLLLSDQ